jgi:hypothetical protein
MAACTTDSRGDPPGVPPHGAHRVTPERWFFTVLGVARWPGRAIPFAEEVAGMLGKQACLCIGLMLILADRVPGSTAWAGNETVRAAGGCPDALDAPI